ncbi:integrase core domain-containing protein [bacterium]|nr:integrase core domain-containing protein [bacterium]
MRAGWKVGRKLVQQVRRLEVKGKKPRRRRGGTSTALPTKAGSANEVWSWDFVHTRAENGVPLKLLTLIDEYTRQCLTIRAQRRLRSGDILDALSEVVGECGVPNVSGVIMDPSSTQKRLRVGLRIWELGPSILIQEAPGKMVMWRSFHDRLGDGCLNQGNFLSVLEAQIVIEEWCLLYNRVHPYCKLGFQRPGQFGMKQPRANLRVQSDPTWSPDQRLKPFRA